MSDQTLGQGGAGGTALAPAAKRLSVRGGPIQWIFTRPKICGWVFILPWLIGFLVFTLVPFLASIVISTLRWNFVSAPRWLGLDNYVKMITDDPRWFRAVQNTVIYVAVSVPLKQVMALAIAMLLDQNLKGIELYRSIFYLPSVTAGVATAILWMQIFGYRLGIFNALLASVGIQPVAWLTSIDYALPTLIFISLWNVGSIFLIYLAGLQGVPTHFYEAAEVDGASAWQKFIKITVPLITPSIFFNVVMGFIGSFQVFTQAFVMTGGGPADRTLFYVLYLYEKGFVNYRMGYAAAMAWFLFLVIMTLTLIQMRLSRRWVYYEGAAPVAQARGL